jgi:hypothetical protein
MKTTKFIPHPLDKRYNALTAVVVLDKDGVIRGWPTARHTSIGAARVAFGYNTSTRVKMGRVEVDTPRGYIEAWHEI